MARGGNCVFAFVNALEGQNSIRSFCEALGIPCKSDKSAADCLRKFCRTSGTTCVLAIDEYEACSSTAKELLHSLSCHGTESVPARLVLVLMSNKAPLGSQFPLTITFKPYTDAQLLSIFQASPAACLFDEKAMTRLSKTCTSGNSFSFFPTFYYDNLHLCICQAMFGR